MDAFVPILPNANAATASGSKSAPDAGDASLFAGMVSAVTPVAPVARRMSGSAANTAAQTPAPALTTIVSNTQTVSNNPAAGLAVSSTTGTANPAFANSGTQTGKLQAGLLSGVAQRLPGQAGNLAGAAMAPLPANGPAVDAALPATNSAASLNGPAVETSTVLPQAGGQPALPDTASIEPITGQGKTGNAESGVNSKASANSGAPANVTAPAVITPPPAPVQVGAGAGIETVQPQTTTNTAAPANPVAAAAAQSASPNAGATQTAATPLQTPEAGVQARRQAQGEPLPAQSAVNSNTKTAASASTAPTASNLPKVDAPQIPQPPATAPTSPTGQSDTLMDPARFMQADTGRLAPLPQAVADPALSDAPVDQDSVDLSSLRAAETSRTAERPGTAAGTARFTPATAGTLAAQIAAKFQNGERRFEIRMDPPELGRVEVRLQVGNDNRVQALLSAERPETLNDMRQYARELERALEEAGLQLDSDGLSFELTQDQDEAGDSDGKLPGFHQVEFAEDEAGPVMAAAPPAELYGFRLNARSGVDIRL